jgi:iron complex transport system substrate-binding protein
MRVISLLPSATEIICALGARAELVGVSHECDWPPDVRGLPVLTRSRIAAEGSSRAIDTAVRSALQNALSIYAVDDERLAALAPDVIVTQDLCEVCAVSIDDLKSAVARLAGREDVRIVSLRATRLADVLADVERVAVAIGRASEGKALHAQLVARVRAIGERSARLAGKPRVISLEWIDPLMLGGTWMPELIELAGGTAIGAKAGEPAPTVQPAELAELRPEVVVVKPCGFTIERTLAERAIIERDVIAMLPAGTRVYITDGNAFFNRPGPRLVESLEIMAACVHPDELGDLASKHAREIVRLA